MTPNRWGQENRTMEAAFNRDSRRYVARQISKPIGVMMFPDHVGGPSATRATNDQAHK